MRPLPKGKSEFDFDQNLINFFCQGLRSVITSTCQCICKPCEEGTILCPTSGVCINETLWCNGVKECPDDETGCEIPTTITTTIITEGNWAFAFLQKILYDLDGF